jgi:hypothetical protein
MLSIYRKSLFHHLVDHLATLSTIHFSIKFASICMSLSSLQSSIIHAWNWFNYFVCHHYRTFEEMIIVQESVCQNTDTLDFTGNLNWTLPNPSVSRWWHVNLSTVGGDSFPVAILCFTWSVSFRTMCPLAFVSTLSPTIRIPHYYRSVHPYWWKLAVRIVPRIGTATVSMWPSTEINGIITISWWGGQFLSAFLGHFNSTIDVIAMVKTTMDSIVIYSVGRPPAMSSATHAILRRVLKSAAIHPSIQVHPIRQLQSIVISIR